MNPNVSLKSNLFTEAFTRNPYPAYSQLREEEPVSYVRLPDGQYAWFITRYDDALEALKINRLLKTLQNWETMQTTEVVYLAKTCYLQICQTIGGCEGLSPRHSLRT